MDAQERIESHQDRARPANPDLRVLPAHEAGHPVPAPVLAASSPARLHGGEHAAPLPDRRRLESGLAAILVVAAAAGMAALARASGLAPIEKVGLGYGAALAATLYGLFAERRDRPLPQATLAVGLSFLYFTTFAGFWLSGIRSIPTTLSPLPFLVACLVLIVVAAQARKSPWVATVGLATVYATAALRGAEPAGTAYALGIGTAGATAALLLHAYNYWLGASWVALAGTYGLLAMHLSPAPGLGLTPEQHFAAAITVLGIAFLVFSFVGIVDLARPRVRTRAVAALILANAAGFYVLGRALLTEQHAAYLPHFHVACALALGALAGLSAALSRRRNPVTEAFLVSAFAVLVLAAVGTLDGSLRWFTLGAGCLVLAILYATTGITILKILGSALLATTFGIALWAMHLRTVAVVGPYTVPGHWIVGAGIPLAWVVAAWVYDCTGIRPATTARRWFLEGRRIDVANAHTAILHAGAAALLLLSVTVFRYEGRMPLPYVLGAQAMALLLAGLVLRAPSVRAAGIALLLAAYAVFAYLAVEGSLSYRVLAPNLAYPAALGGATLLAAYLWERYLKRTYGLPAWQYEPLSLVPYALATLLLATALGRAYGGVSGAQAQAVLGVALLAAGWMLPYPGLRGAGVLALLFSAGSFIMNLLPATPDGASPGALLMVALGIATYVVSERALAVLALRRRTDRTFDDAARTLLVAGAAGIACIGAHTLLSGGFVTLSLVAVALLLLILSRAFRTKRYAWAGLTLLVLGLLRGALYDTSALGRGAAAAGAAAFAVGALAVAMGRMRRRKRSRQARVRVTSPVPPPRSDERPA